MLRKKKLDEMSDNFTWQKKLQDRPLSTNREFPCVCLWNAVSHDEWRAALGVDPSGPQTVPTGPHAEAHILTDHPQRGGPQYWQEMTSALTLSIMVISIITGFYSMASSLQTWQMHFRQISYCRWNRWCKMCIAHILFMLPIHKP